MDAFLGWLQVTAAYAAVGYLGLMAATALWVSQHPDTAIVVTLATSLLLWYQYSKQIKRFIRVFLLWPPVRWYHRLVRKPIRYMTGVIMARWKRAVVADELDETLARLCYEKGIISKQDYRRMSTLIGQALGLTDLVAKKNNQIGIRKRVLANIAAISNETVEAVAAKLQGIKPKAKVKQTVTTGSLNYLKGRKAA
jgi:hypothetical protein